MTHKSSKDRGLKIETYAVILVGGGGKRLRPITTASRPKAFIPVTETDETMFKKTLQRVRRLVSSKNIIVVANKRHRRLVERDFPTIDRENLLLEPLARNTAPAIALAALTLKRRFRDAIMVVLPADHYIIGEDRYIRSIKKAVDFIKFQDRESFLAFGLKPDFPAVTFGYIKIKKQRQGRQGIYKAEKFVEKPNFETARRFLKDGRYLWNSGMFVFKASSILIAFNKFVPEIILGLRELGKVGIDQAYRIVPDISVDYAVMEKADNIYCVRGTYVWRDIGSFNSLREVLERELKSFITSSRARKKEPTSMRILKILWKICGKGM